MFNLPSTIEQSHHQPDEILEYIPKTNPYKKKGTSYQFLNGEICLLLFNTIDYFLNKENRRFLVSTFLLLRFASNKMPIKYVNSFSKYRLLSPHPV